MNIIRLETFIEAPVDRVFDLSRSVELHKLSTQGTHEEAVAGKMAGLVELNDSITWRAKHLGFFQRLTVKIIAMDRPRSFVDTMLKGAFASMKHTHLFEASGAGTLMTDVFEYESPLGMLGRIADKLFLTDYMTKLLINRNVEIKAVAEGDRWRDLLTM
ncbi:SRPBCC family protein [Chryseolinea soli]|uniref:Cell division protein n=1 Tax=Chryseolinea soli TaxID=2321403 RepID=A0A385SLI1_9BACT|nr:SRPBCC family protein [Chryseolinea soli]AYB31137.1 cell division protein [Chryseolinea soli]